MSDDDDTTPSAHHYGITVSDLDESLAFYRDVLGLDVISEFSVGGEAFAEGVGVDGASAEFAHLDAGGTRVELVSYDPEGADRRGGMVNDTGAIHLGLSVPDVEAFHESLSDDVETVADGPRTTASGTTILFVRDPDGTPVEILEA
ncbi:catechol 2,3-dioxygenase-like lactoylglutathione lyase family enzyme [Halarchaeum rubridurum]|uniref:Catechol 2,3-dioxygenase-like lactoylglutathione lyase family enzyme n=1 Tax=Halarchaeum rubridurum TaxID=489911 RepID=A0A830G2E4_9EURY|nr:VOC family protein [Halarchaeum rubridurum]MBP1955363.1 catechol 2,3-dioxygenase-like lactoylglutathione lyase family enzyme [Halarchaeum rubridurum]GGM71809.1 glyoxalase [Halarchaeum rubridurum]